MFGILGFILGIILGSFALALADRSLKNTSILGRSYCPKCKKTLKWYDLIPVFSYLILQGKCRYCNKKIGIEYLLVEIVMGVLIGFLFYQSNFQFLVFNFQLTLILDLISKVFFITILIALTLTDLKKTLIPDRIILPSIVIAFGFLVTSAILRMETASLLYFTLTGSLIGGFFLALILITKGKGMGGGDVKLGGFIGLVLGFPSGLLAIILAFLTGAIAAIFLIISGKKSFGQSLPFGPFLVLGSLISLFWGPQIINWYLSLSI